MSKYTIKVYLRICPDTYKTESNSSIEYDDSGKAITVHLDLIKGSDVVNHTIEDHKFKFAGVFGPNTTQEEVFNRVARDAVQSSMNGYNNTIFAYGATGSGKTHSITGGTASYADRGIIPRALEYIFKQARVESNYVWTIHVSYLQLYGDNSQDLINKGKDALRLEDLPKVSIHETESEVTLRGLDAHPVFTAEEALNLLFTGDTNRLYCETPMNKTSSRSHCVFSVYIESRLPGSASVKRSKLNLVDLAGSERVGKTGINGKLLEEAKFINSSLLYLEQVITALVEQTKRKFSSSLNKESHIPYRNSNLTRVLKDSLGGNCKTIMLATGHPGSSHLNGNYCHLSICYACWQHKANSANK